MTDLYMDACPGGRSQMKGGHERLSNHDWQMEMQASLICMIAIENVSFQAFTFSDLVSWEPPLVSKFAVQFAGISFIDHEKDTTNNTAPISSDVLTTGQTHMEHSNVSVFCVPAFNFQFVSVIDL